MIGVMRILGVWFLGLFIFSVFMAPEAFMVVFVTYSIFMSPFAFFGMGFVLWFERSLLRSAFPETALAAGPIGALAFLAAFIGIGHSSPNFWSGFDGIVGLSALVAILWMLSALPSLFATMR